MKHIHKRYFIAIYICNAELYFFNNRIFRLISSVWKCFVCNIFVFCFPELVLQGENTNIGLRLSANRSIGMISKPFSDVSLLTSFHIESCVISPKHTWDTSHLLPVTGHNNVFRREKKSEFQWAVISKFNRFSFH